MGVNLFPMVQNYVDVQQVRDLSKASIQKIIIPSGSAVSGE